MLRRVVSPFTAAYRIDAASLYCLALSVLLLAFWPSALRAQVVACPASCTVSGTVNDYWPGTSSPTAGAISITVGARRSGGAGQDIAVGDWVVVIQMQDATINTTNGATYGSGGSTGRGYQDARNTGVYEYARAASAVTAAGGTLTLEKPLVNGYFAAAQTDTSTPRRYQVVRLPYCKSMTLSGTISGPAWNGATGGVIAVYAETLDMGGATINANGLGFRGGATDAHNGPWQTGNWASGPNGPSWQSDQYKGEGIAGTPNYIYDLTAGAEISNNGGTSVPTQFPGGYRAKGAPANAGGGGSGDGGAGGGANGGNGGNGGSWHSDSTGGLGGVAISLALRSSARVWLGGGGGGGSAGSSDNNNEDLLPFGTPTDYARGGSGGGIVLVGATTRTGAITITANGNAATTAGYGRVFGGGGAGGSIVVYGSGGSFTSVTALGGTSLLGAYGHTEQGGGGGGGGGGGTIYGTTAAAANVAGGAASTSGTTAGATGVTAGTGPAPGNASCPIIANLALTKTNTPGVNAEVDQATDTVTRGTTTTYTITVTNTGPDPVSDAVLRDTVQTNLTGCSVVTAPTHCTVTSGTATCPAAIDLTWTALTSAAGVKIPSMASNSSIQIKVQCTVQ